MFASAGQTTFSNEHGIFPCDLRTRVESRLVRTGTLTGAGKHPLGIADKSERRSGCQTEVTDIAGMTNGEVMQNEEDGIVAHLRAALPIIDRDLASREFPLVDRTFQAAIEYVQQFVLAVRENGRGEAPPGDTSEFIVTRWFSAIFHQVDQWYHERYGAALDHKAHKYITGVVEIADTPFALRVPTTRARPGKLGETVWIGFPDGVRDDERPIEWVIAGPNIEKLDEEDRARAIAEATQTADRLRYIRTSLMAVSHCDKKLDGLIAGILPRLENAASLLTEMRAGSVQHAYWEMQLACEHALKALHQQQAGAFRETHDLYTLYDATNPKPAFARDVLKRMPPWRETIAMRYGVGDRSGRRLCLKSYRDTLTVVAGSIRSMEKMGIGQAEFELKRPPWFEIADKMRRSAS